MLQRHGLMENIPFFGNIIGNSMDVVNQIEQNDEILSVTIIRKGEAAKKFDAVKVFTNFFANEAENQKKQALIDAENKRIYKEKYKAVTENKMAALQATRKTAEKSKTGLQYKITSKGTGNMPKKGTTIYFNHAGFLENGELFDTSLATVATEFGKFDQNRANQNGYRPNPFTMGEKVGMIPGFIEGLEKCLTEAKPYYLFQRIWLLEHRAPAMSSHLIRILFLK